MTGVKSAGGFEPELKLKCSVFPTFQLSRLELVLLPLEGVDQMGGCGLARFVEFSRVHWRRSAGCS